MGIIIQVVLSNPVYASKLRRKLEGLLDDQQDDGSWSVRADLEDGAALVQFCHGSPGMVISLLAIRKYFPELEDRIDKSVRKARENTWEKGLFIKEPNPCHGITGNTLALEGNQREYFMNFGTMEKIEKGVKEGILCEE
jgi:hypothetical protein